MFWQRKQKPAKRLEATCLGASSEKHYEDSCCDMALTSNVDETWHSGKPAPGYIDLDLGKECDVAHIKLLPYQVPTPARTVHRVWAGKDVDSLEPCQTIDQETRHHQWIDGVRLNKQGVRVLRIETVASPSWPAWSGIQVFGEAKAPQK